MTSDDRKLVERDQSLLAFLPFVRERPGMYLGEPSAYALDKIIEGWKYCLWRLGLRDDLFDAFERWLDNEKHGSVGPRHALLWKTQELGEDGALKWFFECFDEYLQRFNGVKIEA